MRYPGHRRINDIRSRLGQMRHDADEALSQVAGLRREVDALRAEVKQLSIDLGDQLAAQSEAIEHLRRGFETLERQGFPEA